MSTAKTYEILNKINEEFANSLTESNPFELLGSIPINANTEKQYTKFNRLHLSMVLKSFGYKTSRFLTFKQVCAKGGAVKSGEKAFPIFFSSWSYKFFFMGDNFSITAFGESEAIELANKKKATTLIDKSHIKDKYCFTKFFYVFNLEQTDGLEYEDDNTVFAKANTIIESQGLSIKETYGFPLINKKSKELLIPAQEDMTDNEYYPEIFKTLTEFYIEEELEHYEKQMITHIASAFLSQSCGLKTPVITIADPSLVDSWLDKLNESYYFLWRCSTTAQKIHDEILEKVSALKAA
jgi:antirestriction protein ArdC